MKHLITLISVLFVSLILIGCSAGRYPYPGPKTDLGKETWESKIDRDPGVWAMQADEWFVAGGATKAVMENRKASVNEAMTRESVRVADFHHIKANGNFQIQIVGDPDVNSVTIDGPNEAVHSLSVGVTKDSLCLDQMKDAPPSISRVIVRIHVRDLRSLIHNGGGRVEGVRLYTDALTVENNGCGNVFLAGHMNVKKIIARGTGTVNIFTVTAYNTEIETYDSAGVNLSARRAVWLRSIKHQGSGNINVIGASSQGLTISAVGKGKIGISGLVSIKEIKASNETCVFIENSASPAPCVYVYDDARVGIAGRAYTFNGYTTRNARLMARNLFASNSYVEASGESHMNVNATNKIFATANDYATIYYYGDPARLTEFKNHSGSVIEMGSPNSPDEVIVSRNKHHAHRAPCYVEPQGSIKMGWQGDSASARHLRGSQYAKLKVNQDIYV